MKSVIVAILASLPMTEATGQDLAVGVRPGVTSWGIVKESRKKPVQRTEDGDGTTFSSELFARYATKGKFAIEAGFSHNNREMTPFGRSWTFGAGGLDSSYNRYSMRYLDFNLGVQYNIVLPCREKRPLLSKMSNYVGVLFNPSIVTTYGTAFVTYKSDGESPDSYTQVNSFKHIAYNIGVSHTLVYSLSEHFQLISSVNARIYLNHMDYLGHYQQSNGRLTCGIGAGYKF